MIALDNICKSYGGATALDRVSLRVERGEMVALTGCDGAGKSTLLRIVTTLLLPDSGSGTVGGMDIRRQASGIRRICGYMPERFSLYEDLTVEENLKFYATLFGTSIREGYGNIKGIYSQIERFKDRRAGALSGGMKQKLALCCALVHKPQLLVLDEPTTGVDPVSRKELWDTLGTINRSGVTVIAATPYIDEIRRCGRAVFIDKGCVMGTGSPDDILTRFADIFCPDRPRTQNDMKDSGRQEVIKVSRLVKAFGSFRAVDDISFNVRKGEIFGFLGANGAGKSTLLKCISGLLKPQSGEVSYDGEVLPRTANAVVAKGIAMVPEGRWIFPNLTVEENLLMGGYLSKNRGEGLERAYSMFKRLKERRSQRAGTMSGGEQQMLAIARGLMANPKVLILDEPSLGLAPLIVNEVIAYIDEINQQGVTILLVEQNARKALKIAHHACVMEQGKIVRYGTGDEIAKDENVVAAYLGRKK